MIAACPLARRHAAVLQGAAARLAAAMSPADLEGAMGRQVTVWQRLDEAACRCGAARASGCCAVRAAAAFVRRTCRVPSGRIASSDRELLHLIRLNEAAQALRCPARPD